MLRPWLLRPWLLALTLLLTRHATAGEETDIAAIERRILAPLHKSTGRRLSYPGSEHLTAARAQIAAGKTAQALASLDAWLDLEYRNSNWWVNHVPIPRAVGEIALLLRDDLGAERLARVMVVLKRAWPPPRGGIGVGANLFYRVDAAILQALLLRDAQLLNAIFARAAAEIRITTKEGIQEDLSFHQHGPQFYSGSYGLEYIRGAVHIATLAHGTGLALPPEKMDLLVALLLDGLQWIVYGPMIDPGAQGRNFSRRGARSGGRAVAAYCTKLAELNPPRREEFARFASALTGNRCFWRSDFMVHRRPGWYASTKMASLRTVGTESGNGEGLRQYHLADGACLLLQRGDEYADIQPVWNWRRIPGTTCVQKEGALPLINWGRGARGRTAFVGGASDGRFGVACMALDKAGVKARKSWFYFDDEVVCLGAGISAEGKHAVVTTLNQCLAEGEFKRGEGWAVHDGVGYIALDGTLEVASATQTGTWKSINKNYSNAVVEKQVFSAWIDHGIAPQDASYAYVLRPGTTAKQTAAYAAAPKVAILINTQAAQAVRHSGLGVTSMVFHEAGSVAGISVDRPCALLIVRGAKGVRVSVADPAQANQPIRVTLSTAAKPIVLHPKAGKTETLALP